MNKKTTILSLLFIICGAISVNAQVQFTPQEQQSISVETPGLFERSNGFTVDFGQLGSNEYSFPLPVGKVEGIRQNNDIIITTTTGDVVKSMFSGVVRLSRNISPFGNTVVVRHDNGLETVYANNSSNLVKVGDKVKAGQSLAIVGTLNDKTYCEFAIMVNGARLNPETLLELKSHRLRRQTLLFEKNTRGVKITVKTEEKEQTLQKQSGRRTPQRGNMTTNQNKKVKETVTADDKYKKNTEVMAQHFDDNDLDIDEFQAIKFEENVRQPAKSLSEFTINFGAMKSEEWCYPMKGAHVISPFGGKRRHAGTDIKRQPGDPVLAAFDGQVVLSGTHYGYGLCVVLRHANGLETLYSHQSKNTVKVGEWVKAGQQIGVVGRTGRATTEHCHFETRINGRPFDSAKVYDHANNRLKSCVLTYRNGRIYIGNSSGDGGSASESEVAVHSKGAGASRTAAKRTSGKSSKSRSKKRRR